MFDVLEHIEEDEKVLQQINKALKDNGLEYTSIKFSFEYFDEAEREYFNMFSNNPDNKNIVLTHLNKTSFEKLSIAYSNYFLTYNATLFRILKAISDITIYAYNHYRFIGFKKNYRAFWIISITWFGKKLEEADIFNKDVNVRKSIKKKKEWFVSIASSLQIVNSIINNMQKGFHSNFLYIVMKYYKGRIDKELMTDLIRELCQHIRHLKY